MDITVEVPDELFAFYSAYLRAINATCGEYLAQLLREDVNALIESLEPEDIPLVFRLPSTLRVSVLTNRPSHP